MVCEVEDWEDEELIVRPGEDVLKACLLMLVRDRDMWLVAVIVAEKPRCPYLLCCHM